VRAPIPLDLPDPPLADGVVRLRPWRANDVAALVAICDDPDVARFTPLASPYTEADARIWLAAEPGRRRAGDELALAVLDAAGTPVGALGLRPDPDDREIVEVGYVVAAPARGRGLATHAVRLAVAWAIDRWRPARVQLTTTPDNVASHRVAERAGFRREGLLRAWARDRGTRVDLVMWSRLPGDG
jgi:RimJ/RimL family protein N-acetyltransferase